MSRQHRVYKPGKDILLRRPVPQGSMAPASSDVCVWSDDFGWVVEVEPDYIVDSDSSDLNGQEYVSVTVETPGTYAIVKMSDRERKAWHETQEEEDYQ